MLIFMEDKRNERNTAGYFMCLKRFFLYKIQNQSIECLHSKNAYPKVVDKLLASIGLKWDQLD